VIVKAAPSWTNASAMAKPIPLEGAGDDGGTIAEVLQVIGSSI
jgi:hypothetical protein